MRKTGNIARRILLLLGLISCLVLLTISPTRGKAKWDNCDYCFESFDLCMSDCTTQACMDACQHNFDLCYRRNC
jgi:hypothetical protein